MRRFNIHNTSLEGVKIVERRPREDSRGLMVRLYCSKELAKIGWVDPIAQINHTVSKKKGTIRGMHFQFPPHAETKLVTCIKGKVWDVAVDVRAGSPTFLQWHAEFLSEENNYALFIPHGFAHGFQCMTDNVELLYCHSSHYQPDAEFGLNPVDKRLNILWPLPIEVLSEKDARNPWIDKDFKGVVL